MKTRLPLLEPKFRCEAYRCVISERDCVTRQAHAAAAVMPVLRHFAIKGSISAELLSRCRDCEQGRGVAAGYVGEVTVTSPKERKARWGNRPQEIREALEMKGRWEKTEI